MKKLKYLMTLALLLMLALLAYYLYINRDKGDSNQSEVEAGEVAKVLSMDLENNYPLTPREVVLYFTNIQKCYYNRECSENEVKQLADKASQLFDEELLKNNNYDEYYEKLSVEIEEYKSAKRTISNIILDKASNIVYSELDGVKYAQINCIYYLKTSKETTKVTEVYALRRDEDNKWKILGWDVYKPSDYEQ